MNLPEEDEAKQVVFQEKAGNDWLAGATIYQVYVRSFQDSSGNGTGDLRGVLRRLEHITGLGADAMWLSPFFVSPMKDMGYDIADHCNVDPLFGSLMDFDELVADAHDAGLKIIIDLVFSHTSDQHPWFQQSMMDRANRHADWYVWADPKPDGTPPNNWLSVFGGSAWTWNRYREQYYLHDFLPSQPSLDFANPDVRGALLEIVEFWSNRGVDAFRLDTMNSYFHDRDLRDNPPLPEDQRNRRPKVNPFAQQLHLYDRAQRGDLGPLEAFVAAIEMLDKATIVGQLGNRLKTYGRQGLGQCYTYTLLGAPFSAGALSEAISEAVENSPDGRICCALSNHDTTRHVTRFCAQGQDIEAVAKLSATLLACLPGAISLYQGEELGLPEGEVSKDQLRDPFGQAFWPAIKGRDGCRTPLPWDSSQTNAGFSSEASWLPVSPDHIGLGAASQERDPSSVLSHYRMMIGLRKQSAALSNGRFESLGHSGEVFCFLRRGSGETVLAAFNCGQETAKFALSEEVAGLRPIAETIGAGRLEAGQVTLPGLSFFVGWLA